MVSFDGEFGSGFVGEKPDVAGDDSGGAAAVAGRFGVVDGAAEVELVADAQDTLMTSRARYGLVEFSPAKDGGRAVVASVPWDRITVDLPLLPGVGGWD